MSVSVCVPSCVTYVCMLLGVEQDHEALSPPPPPPSLQLSEDTDHQEEKVRLYRALGQTDNVDILAKCHEYSISVSETHCAVGWRHRED